MPSVVWVWDLARRQVSRRRATGRVRAASAAELTPMRERAYCARAAAGPVALGGGR